MFQALAQNTDLKERLCRIHAESLLLDRPVAAKSGDRLAEVGNVAAPCPRRPPCCPWELCFPHHGQLRIPRLPWKYAASCISKLLFPPGTLPPFVLLYPIFLLRITLFSWYYWSGDCAETNVLSCYFWKNPHFLQPIASQFPASFFCSLSENHCPISVWLFPSPFPVITLRGGELLQLSVLVSS